MKPQNKRALLATALFLAIIVADQAIKVWVKTNMPLHSYIDILPFFRILFIENNGMAWGMEIGSKLALTLLRVAAIGIGIYYLAAQVRLRAKWGYIACITMVLAGAMGNLIDCMFYGLIFSGASENYASYFVPFGTGYSSLLTGKVVDMFSLSFFPPVFNFGDACISVGVALLLLFYRNELSHITLNKEKMRKAAGVASVAALLLAANACTPSVPAGVIPPDEMEELLYDYHKAAATAFRTQGEGAAQVRRNVLCREVLRQHGLTEAQFDSALVYYYTDTERLYKIYHRLSQRLESEVASLGGSVAQGEFEGLSNDGDTASVWNGPKCALLMPIELYNRLDFELTPDSTYKRGDTFLLNFNTQFLYQSGTKDATCYIAVEYDNDTIITAQTHISYPGLTQMRTQMFDGANIKGIRGFVYLSRGNDESETLKLMSIENIQLIRFHKIENDSKCNTDSLQLTPSYSKENAMNQDGHTSSMTSAPNATRSRLRKP